MQFTNHAGEQVNLNEKMKLNAGYDILNYWNFPEGLGLKAKLDSFPHMVHLANNFLYLRT